MKYVIKSITGSVLDTSGATSTYTFPIIPGTGILSVQTDPDGLTEEIRLSIRLKWNDTIPDELMMDMGLVIVDYDKDGTNASFSFGSKDLPVHFQVTDDEARTVSCTYERAI